MEQEYTYWEIWYRNLESDEVYAIAKTPEDWTEYDVQSRMEENHDISRVISVCEISKPDDYLYDLT